MGRQHLSTETYGTHATEWPDGLFAIRINNESDTERIDAAIRAEAQRSDPRQARIGLCNRRKNELEE